MVEGDINNCKVHAWQGLGADVDGGASVLPDLLDLASLLADDGPALGGGHQQVQRQTLRVSAVT